MNRKLLFNELLLVLGTSIWGAAFIFQDIGSKYLEAFSFCVGRGVIGTITLFLLALILYVINSKKEKNTNELTCQNGKIWLYGSAIAIFTAAGMGFQQLGISTEGAGKSGFITSLYIIIVPFIGLMFGKKTHPLVLISIVFALTGLYAINTGDGFGFTFGIGTIYLLLCALSYAIQIYLIGLVSNKCNSIHLSAVQFLVSTILLIPFMFIFEKPTLEGIYNAFWPLMFCGVLSTGVAFTIQIYTQKNIPTSIATVIMSLESVFSILFAVIILKETYLWFQTLGCVLIFVGVIVCQIPSFKKKKQD